jgi:hypothetical protein
MTIVSDIDRGTVDFVTIERGKPAFRPVLPAGEPVG